MFVTRMSGDGGERTRARGEPSVAILAPGRPGRIIVRSRRRFAACRISACQSSLFEHLGARSGRSPGPVSQRGCFRRAARRCGRACWRGRRILIGATLQRSMVRTLSAAAGVAIGLVASGIGPGDRVLWDVAAPACAQPPVEQTAPVPPGAAPVTQAAPPAPTAAAPAPKQEWSSFPTMLLEKMYRGPLRDTIIQRWRDPIDGSVCFVYMPISAPLLPPTAEGYVGRTRSAPSVASIRRRCCSSGRVGAPHRCRLCMSQWSRRRGKANSPERRTIFQGLTAPRVRTS